MNRDEWLGRYWPCMLAATVIVGLYAAFGMKVAVGGLAGDLIVNSVRRAAQFKDWAYGEGS